MAVPSVNEGVTVRPPGTALSSVTVKAMALPSSALALAMVTSAGGGASSSTIVPVAAKLTSNTLSPSQAVHFMVRVSSPSSSVSPVTLTSTVFEVSPGAKVSVPLVAV